MKISAPGWEVVSFTLSLQPKGKDYCGPYITKGSKLTDKEIAVIRKLRDEKVGKVQVFFEEVEAKGPDGVHRKLGGALVFTILDDSPK